MNVVRAAAREAFRVNTRQVARTDMDGSPDALQIVGTKISGRYVVELEGEARVLMGI